MRKLASIGIAAVSIAFSSICHAQMSVFPSPPPLPPRSSETSQAPNNPASQPTQDQTVNPSSTTTSSGTTPDTSTPANPPVTTPPSSIPITAATLTSMTALDDKVPLKAEDRISFRVIEDQDPSIQMTITDTGEVDFPYIGRLKVQGLTCRQVAGQLKRLLEVDYYKSATVIIGLDVIAEEKTPKDMPHEVAWVYGQVRQIGPQEILPKQPITVSQIILKAGGFGDFADQRKIRLIHSDGSTSTPDPAHLPDPSNVKDAETVDVKAVLEGESKFDPVVKPNDKIYVPKRLINY